MKFRQSAAPYLFLLAGLIFGIPSVEQIAIQQENTVITHKIVEQPPLVAECEYVFP